MRFYRPALPARLFFSSGIFRIKTRERKLILSFDDGPVAGSTESILEVLGSREVSAVFFCSGEAAEKSPELVNMIRAQGHLIGNHGYHHLDGLRTTSDLYLENAARADRFTSASLFRPPYGRMTPAQYRLLRAKYYIVLWDVMAYDFDTNFSAEASLDVLKKKIRNGSVIVLHDSPVSSVHVYLAEFIDYARQRGFSFDIPHSLFTAG
jgi:peptidoglycan-N-acetylglucosamine deacetylase